MGYTVGMKANREMKSGARMYGPCLRCKHLRGWGYQSEHGCRARAVHSIYDPVLDMTNVTYADPSVRNRNLDCPDWAEVNWLVRFWRYLWRE
jgi:hypothetical protein